MKGYIHQLESFGSVDGPGVRFIVFVSGCRLRRHHQRGFGLSFVLGEKRRNHRFGRRAFGAD